MGGGYATAAGGEIYDSATNVGTEHTPFCGSERKEEEADDPKTVARARGVQPSFLLQLQAADFYAVQSLSIEYSECTHRKSIKLTMLRQGNTLFLGYRELLGRQQLMQDCGVG